MKSKSYWMAVVCLMSAPCLVGFAEAAGYSTDFSANPGWATDQPTLHYWDYANQWYHVRSENNPPGYPGPTTYQPNRYAGAFLSQAPGSFALQWDTQITQSQWSAGVDFGIFDSHLESLGRFGGQGITLSMSWTDKGNSLGLFGSGAGGLDARSTESVGGDFWQSGVWYRSYLTYDRGTNLVNFDFTDRATGTTLWTASLTVPGGFSRELIFLGNTRYGIVDLEGGAFGLNPYAANEGNIDNVSLTPIPAPAALILAGIGAGLTGWLRRRKAM